MEKFNPGDPKYKKVEDLPEQERGEYVPYKDGFVRREAMKAWEFWENEAKRKNDNRFVLKKIFNLNYNDAMSLASKEARADDKERNSKIVHERFVSNQKSNADVELLYELEQRRFGGLLEMAFRFLIDAIKEHEFDVVISEDRAGRLPAEILLRTINRIYIAANEEPASLAPISLRRAEPYDVKYKLVRETIQNLVQANKIKKGLLYVTDYISSGRTAECAITGISDAITTPCPNRKDGKYLVGVAAVYSDIWIEFDEMKELSPYLKTTGHVSNWHRPGQAQFILKKYSGLYQHSDYPLNEGEIRARNEYMQKISDNLFEVYKESVNKDKVSK